MTTAPRRQRSGALLWALRAVACVGLTSSWQIWDEGLGSGPGARDGHTLVVFNHTVFMFGGRGNETIVAHDPKTFDIVAVNGSLSFVTYDGKPVKECGDLSFHECHDIMVGTYYNDIWGYPLDCPGRGWDTGCAGWNTSGPSVDAAAAAGHGWRLLAPTVPMGGCTIKLQKEVCTTPAERFGHSAAVFSSGVMYVYGGFSRLCEDYCSDLWSFDVGRCWATGDPQACAWRLVANHGGVGSPSPGRRWKMASTYDGERWVTFGGHRLWHGFSPANTLYNRWRVTDPQGSNERYEYGGYLDDMWEWREDTHKWRQILPLESCYSRVTWPAQWDTRYDIRCTVHWPEPRAGAAIALHNKSALYLHGGYRTPFPYPHALAAGAGIGVAPVAEEALAPSPSHPYFLGDMWRYDLSTGLWVEIKPVALPPGTVTEGVPGGQWLRLLLGSSTAVLAPRPRRGHNLLAVEGTALVLFGGYGSNNYMDDTWLFNVTTGRWVPKPHAVHPIYPGNCTSDVIEEVQYEDPSDPTRPTSVKVTAVNMSVLGEPTRGTPLDGVAGRARFPVLVPSVRRQAPGWDGCRDRADGRTDLPWDLQWKQPSQRTGAAAAYDPTEKLVVLFGGERPVVETSPGHVSSSPSTTSDGQLWGFFLNHCANNCSGHGDCHYGFCFCHDGWYGVDCSNMTCPGDFCYYDPYTHTQQCDHCCSAPYVHSDADYTASTSHYVPYIRKQRCSANQTGTSHGICDGFGQCQCAPPFIGPDCSTMDCPNGCSGNGKCSVEYPVSRCLCNPPYTGVDCGTRMCPNNCSWPNGECVDGACVCSWMANPYNRDQKFVPYQGDDCSYVTVFAGAEGVLGGGSGLGAAARLLALPLLAALAALAAWRG